MRIRCPGHLPDSPEIDPALIPAALFPGVRDLLVKLTDIGYIPAKKTMENTAPDRSSRDRPGIPDVHQLADR